MITLERAYTDMGTFSTWAMPNGFQVYTVERPWLDNMRSMSCIPEGVYRMEKRASPVVERTSRGHFTHGWEITGVPDRTYIMLHPGNTASDIEGCIAPGTALGFVNGQWAVTNSQKAFRALMRQLETQPVWDIDIRAKTVSYP